MCVCITKVTITSALILNTIHFLLVFLLSLKLSAYHLQMYCLNTYRYVHTYVHMHKASFCMQEIIIRFNKFKCLNANPHSSDFVLKRRSNLVLVKTQR